MPIPVSRSAMDRLGERLRDAEQPSDDDRQLLGQITAAHQRALLTVESLITEAVGIAPTTRPKTIGTIIEKLRRESMRLSQMVDLAGARLTIVGDRSDQDRVVAQIVPLFPGCNVVDRRADPRHGYRAVHVLAVVDGCRVEIQVRTELQDMWANLMERFADRFGRGLRYGEGPDTTDPEARAQIEEIVEGVQLLSDTIADNESITVDMQQSMAMIEQRQVDALEEAELAGTEPDAELLVLLDERRQQTEEAVRSLATSAERLRAALEGVLDVIGSVP